MALRNVTEKHLFTNAAPGDARRTDFKNWTLPASALFLALEVRGKEFLPAPSGRHLRPVTINSIEHEDGSGKSLIVKGHDKEGSVLMYVRYEADGTGHGFVCREIPIGMTSRDGEHCLVEVPAKRVFVTVA